MLVECLVCGDGDGLLDGFAEEEACDEPFEVFVAAAFVEVDAHVGGACQVFGDHFFYSMRVDCMFR